MAVRFPERITIPLAPAPVHYTMPSRPRHRESSKNSQSERKRTKNTAQHRERTRGATTQQRPSNAAEEMHQDIAVVSTRRPIDQSHLSPYGHLSDPVSESAYDSFSDYTTPGFGDDLSDIALSSMLSLDDTVNQAIAPANPRSGPWSDSSSKDGSSSVGDSIMHPDTRLLSPAPTNPSVSRTSTLNIIAVEPTASPPSPNSRLLSNIQYAGGSTPAVAQSSPGQLGGMKRMDGQNDPSDSSNTRRGMDPVARNQIDEASIPSLEDQQKERELATTKAGVEKWLTTTNVTDPANPYATNVKDHSKESAMNRQYSEAALSPRTIAPVVSSPGPGVYVNQEDDDDDEDEDEETADNDSDDPGDSDVDNNDTTPPAPYIPKRATAPTPSDTSAAQTAGWAKKPWVDSPFESDSASLRGQPMSSNAAIARFARRAKDTETASVTATIASSFRRRSLESMFSAANISIVPPSEADSASVAPDIPEGRRSSLLGKILPKRSPSKNREVERKSPEERSRKDSAPPRSPMKRVPSWARSKSPSISSLSIPPTPLAQQPRSATMLTPSSGPWTSVTNVIKRARSRSDLGAPSALAERWASSGGPPVPNLRPPLQQEPEPELGIDRHDSFDSREGDIDAEGDGHHTPTAPVDMVMGPMEDLAAPTPECFRAHTLNANPRIEFFMLERVTSEQLKRYRRLVEALIKHKSQVNGNHCPSGDRCGVLGSGPQMLDSRRVGAESEFSAVTFYITQAGSESDSAVLENDSIPASFPEGIPLPPPGVQRLPAEFECPLCFQVKKFLKPSDWTKHVHEDLQPFTCSFPDCVEPKSFKRKADWVRHENERHRQLEKWICNFQDCQHVCYRKDNFVQHLVREHKMPEPKMRASKAAVRAGSQDKSQVGQLIETCRFETTRRPDEEACRFCGNYLTSWKKLSAHLAKHMEHNSLPVLSLVRQVEAEQNALKRSSSPDQGYSRQQDAPGAASIQHARQVTPLDTSFGGLEPGEQPIGGQSQYYSQTPTSSSDSTYRSDGVYGSVDVYAGSRAGTNTYPGARNLERRPSAEPPVTQPPVQFVDNQAYAQASPTSTYMSVFDDSINIMPGSTSHGPSMTYPPAFVPSTSQAQPNATYTHSPLYSVEQMYDQTFPGADYAAPSNIMQQQGYQYSPGTVDTSAMQYTQHAASPYSSEPPSRKPSAQFSPMAPAQYSTAVQVPSHQYPQGPAPQYATGPTPFPQIQVHPYGESQPHSQAGMQQQQYVTSSPSEAAAGQGYLASNPTFGEQASGAGRGSARYPNQQQQYARYYRR